jgi:hypothetical protein
MLKTAIATLTLGVAALLTTVTATPAFAATITTATAQTLVLGPQVTITVSCPKHDHAVDHSDQLSCLRDKTHHKVTKPAAKPDTKVAAKPASTTPAAAPVQWSRTGAFGSWHHWSHWYHHGSPCYYWHGLGDHSWL